MKELSEKELKIIQDGLRRLLMDGYANGEYEASIRSLMDHIDEELLSR